MQTEFSPRRRFHANPTGGEVTGETSVAAMLDETNRYAQGQSYRDSLQGWEGCIDAPCILPAGSMVDLPPRDIAGMYWEGAQVSRNVDRG